MNLYINKSEKINFDIIEEQKKVIESIKELEDEFDYLIFTDYEGSKNQRFSMALSDNEKDDTVPFYIDDSINHIVIKFTFEQMNDILNYAYSLEQEGKIKRAYTIDYIKKNNDVYEFFVSVE